MVVLETVQQSNKLLASLPQAKDLVAVFIGASSGIGKSALEHFANSTTSPRIYSTARIQSADSHHAFLQSLRETNPSGTYNLLQADASLISEIDHAVEQVLQQESKVDLLFMSPGFFAFDGREDTLEGLDPSMSTRYYSRQHAAQRLLPLLNAAPRPRVVSVLAAGEEGFLNEADLDLRQPENWSVWNSSRQACTMGTLALEVLAHQNPTLSIIHMHPGAVSTPGLARSNAHGLNPPNPRSQDEAGQRALFVSTNDRYSVKDGLVPMIDGLEKLPASGGGIFLVGPDGELKDNEKVLAGLRSCGAEHKVWGFTQEIFASALAISAS